VTCPTTRRKQGLEISKTMIKNVHTGKLKDLKFQTPRSKEGLEISNTKG
jgi:hypothetical protein